MTTWARVDLEAQFFDTFLQGQQLAAEYRTALDGSANLDRELEDRLRRVPNLAGIPGEIPDEIARINLTAITGKFALEHARSELEEAQKIAISQFGGQLVTIRALDRSTQPLTEYYFSSGLSGSRTWEPRVFQPQKSKGHIAHLSLNEGTVRVTPRKRNVIRRMDRSYSEARVFDDDGDPLISVNFL